jgi:hypothetical protein
MANPDTFGPCGVGLVDITPTISKEAIYVDYHTRPTLVRIYFSDRLGRRSKQYFVDYKTDIGISQLRSQLAFDGQVEVPVARLWGKVIHGIGTEEGIMTVHLRQRYAE